MKFFDCTQCLMVLRPRHSSRRYSCQTMDPLVTTKRPPDCYHRYNHYRPESGQGISVKPATRLLTIIRGFGVPWRKRGRITRMANKNTKSSELKRQPKRKRILRGEKSRLKCVRTPKSLNGVHLKKREIMSAETARGNDTGQEDDVSGSSARALEREYYEHLEALKFLIDPPPCFRNTETRQNFENKLNSLDFRRMNTIAMPEVPTTNVDQDSKNLNEFCPSWSSSHKNGITCKNRGRSYVEAIDCIVAEHLKFEQTMFDLFVKAPILKSKPREQMLLVRENKTVRFKDEVEKTKMSIEQEKLKSKNVCREIEEYGLNRIKIAVASKQESHVCQDVILGESSKLFDVETRNGR